MTQQVNENEKKRAPLVADSEKFLLKKQRKKEKSTATKDGEWERCMFKLVRKNRFCNMERYPRKSLRETQRALSDIRYACMVQDHGCAVLWEPLAGRCGCVE